MIKIISTLSAIFISINMMAQTNETKVSEAEMKVVEASCGQCQFKLEGKGCSLAVRMGDKAYFVDGSTMDEHGDAHGTDGMCTTIRKAKVKGQVENGRFVASHFELIPTKEKE